MSPEVRGLRSEDGRVSEGCRNMSEVGGGSEVGRHDVGHYGEDLASASGAAPSLQ